jgi:probable rRNA maturation factor
MTVQITFQSTADFHAWEEQIVRACSMILKQLELEHGALTVVLTDEETIRDMNDKYAGLDHATDVLSFTNGETDPETGIPYLGDILIAVPIAERQAAEYGHSTGAELSLLAIHGLLHLMGYDHSDDEGKERMWTLQASALRSLGISNLAMERS